jgi:3-phosphoglycerate kinase
MELLSIQRLNVEGRRVLVRVDFNVPIKDGVIQDDTRIRAALPTLRALLARGASLVVCSHLGRPKKGPDPALSLEPAAERLSGLLGRVVRFCPEPAGAEAERLCGALRPGEVLMLENLRFDPGEEANDPGFSEKLSRLAHAYVDDAFGTAHRPAASIVGVAELLPSAAGLLLEKEIRTLDRLTSEPAKPLVMLAGGAKISDKIAVIDRLADKLDLLLVGGAMAFTFLRAQGLEIGRSLLDEKGIETARRLLDGTLPIKLPVDFAAATEPGAEPRFVRADGIPAALKGLDIGPETIEIFRNDLRSAGTVLWNGPMGLFEVPPFDRGTRALARALVESEALSVVGGGETGEIVKDMGLAEKLGHVSTGGGAFLSYLSGETLPGVEVLQSSAARLGKFPGAYREPGPPGS